MGTHQNSQIIICKDIKMDKAYKNVLSYTEAEMVTLCTQNAVASANDYSFIDYARNEVLVGFSYGECLQSNYIAFQNPYYHSKWFFGWIDNVEYRSDSATKITFTVDAWSTFFSSWSTKACYVIREHTNDDTIGTNTVDEGLSVQDVVSIESDTDASLGQFLYVGVLTNWNVDEKTGFAGISITNRGVFGSKLCLFPYNTTANLAQLLYFIMQTNADGHVEDIKDIFIVPSALITASDLVQHTYDVVIGGGTIVQDAWYYTLGTYTYDNVEYDWNINKTLSFSDITLKNNKCYCYPYNYLYVTNNVGNSNVLKYEDFTNSTQATFKVQLALSIGCSGRLVPVSYKGVAENIDEGITLAKYPTCQWSSDSFTNWITQNAVNTATQFMNLGLSATGAYNSQISSISQTGNVDVASGVQQVGSLANQVAGIIGNYYSAQLLPEKVAGSNTGDVNFSSNDNTFKISHMRAKKEYLHQIDDYFTRFGYKTLRNKVPNITGRSKYNYIEIGQGESIGYGNVPVNYMNIINSACQSGVTIWHNHSDLGDFSVDNPIV